MSEQFIQFKDYADDYISRTTKYRTAEELLKSKTKINFLVWLLPNYYRAKFCKKFFISQELDFDAADFIRFLNFTLNIYPEYFHEWSEYKLETNSLFTKDYDDHTIGTTFAKGNNFIAQISVAHENFKPENPVRWISFDVSPRVFGTISLGAYKRAVRAVPVLRAAFDYYLNVYLKNQPAEAAAE